MKKVIFSILVLSSSLVCSQQIVFDEGLLAFEQTLYPKLRQNCSACHGDGGLQVGHSVSQVKQAYLVAKEYADFSNPTNSIFYRKVKKQHWLKSDPNAKGMTENEIAQAMNDWWLGGENKIASTYALVTEEIQLPVVLPKMSDGGWLGIKWDLGKTNIAYDGCTFSLDIQKVSDNKPDEAPTGSYRVKNPTISCLKKGFRFSGLLISVSQEVASFENIYADSEAQSIQSSVPSLFNNEIMILLQRNLKNNDKILIIFKQINPL